jgi:amidase
VLPTCPAIAPLTHARNDVHEAFRLRAMRMTCIAGLSGLPQVSLPVGTIGGSPVGLSFIGWAGGDETLLDLAAWLARYCGMTA